MVQHAERDGCCRQALQRGVQQCVCRGLEARLRVELEEVRPVMGCGDCGKIPAFPDLGSIMAHTPWPTDMGTETSPTAIRKTLNGRMNRGSGAGPSRYSCRASFTPAGMVPVPGPSPLHRGSAGPSGAPGNTSGGTIPDRGSEAGYGELRHGESQGHSPEGDSGLNP